MASQVLYTVDEGAGIARITLDRPERRNALNRALVEELKDSLALAESDERVRVIVIGGSGPDFCAGADLRELQEAVEAGPDASLAEAQALGDLFVLIRKLEKPVVALVHGQALAGGAASPPRATSCWPGPTLGSATRRCGSASSRRWSWRFSGVPWERSGPSS